MPQTSPSSHAEDMFEETFDLGERDERELPEAIRRVCENSGIFLSILVPGLGRALVIPERSLGDLIGLFKSSEFAASLERSLVDFNNARGAVRMPGVAPGDELLPLQDEAIAESLERGVADFAAAKGIVRPADKFPE